MSHWTLQRRRVTVPSIVNNQRRAIFCLSLTLILPLWLGAGVVKAADIGAAAIAAHIERLRSKLPADTYTIVSQPPFVVIGDEPAAIVRDRAVHTVGWAVDRLKQDFFEQDPPAIIDIWLMKDELGYAACARGMLGRQPQIQLGFYASAQRALVINLTAGTGTLVHEIVHPFIHANFPACPVWFNEGLASLFERADERAGHIIGLTNWRLPHLQRLIRADRCPTIAAVTALDRGEFYNRDEADNYAVARGLCYYLQEQGQLVPFYRAFRANYQTDPTGLRTLQQTLHEANLSRLQIKWEKFVRALTVTT